MKQLMAFILALVCVLSLVGCSEVSKEANPSKNIAVTTATEAKAQSEVLRFLFDKYDLKFKLWGQKDMTCMRSTFIPTMPKESVIF